MDYNSNRKKLILPEYGRIVQKMVNYAVTLEDREERNRATRQIIEIMGNMYPYLRDIPDFRHKLWDHIAIMSNFKLDIDAPYDPPKVEELNQPPSKVPYNNSKIKYRHYGKTLELMINEAALMEDGKEKEVLINLLANQMKKAYLIWNKDSVNDEKIAQDLNELSNAEINLDENIQLTETRNILNAKNKAQGKQQHRNPRTQGSGQKKRFNGSRFQSNQSDNRGRN